MGCDKSGGRYVRRFFSIRGLAMVDIHTHILPGIDDGAKDFAEALEMAELSVGCGVDTLVCTPHTNIEGVYENYDSAELSGLFLRFQEALRREHIPLRVLRGSEVFSTLDMQKRIDNGEICSLNGTGYYLVEFGFDAEPGYIAEVLYGMQRFGVRPVLAHPERYDCIKDMPQLVYEWAEDGVLCQVNRGSLLGKFGKRVERAAHILLSHNLITCVASDAHRAHVRTTFMRDVYDMLSHEGSGELAEMLLVHQPRMLVNGEAVRNKRIIPFAKKGWFYK